MSPHEGKRSSIINSTIGVVVKLTFALLGAVALSITIECVGITSFWSAEKDSRSRDMYNYELSMINDGQYGYEPTEFQNRALSISLKINDVIDEYVDILDTYINRKSERNNLRIGVLSIYEGMDVYVAATVNVVKIFVLRFSILVMALPLFAFSGLIGLVDGFVERDLRRWGAGRESSTVFNLARTSVIPMAIGAWVFYLSFPFSIQPIYVILPFVAAFGIAIRVCSERLKKYF